MVSTNAARNMPRYPEAEIHEDTTVIISFII
jgi:hypothetical protein